MNRRWRMLAALTFARTSMGFQFQSIASTAPFLTADLALDKAQLGWLIGLYLLPGVVIALPGGLLGARFGDKRVTLFGLGLMVAGGGWLAIAPGFAQANAARLVGGAGAVVLNVLLTKMVADWFVDSKERLLAMSVLINAWPIGVGLALFALGPFAEVAGWPWAMVSTALFAGLGLCAVLLLYRPPAAAVNAAGSLALRTITATEWRLLASASLPWLLFNAAYQILVSFLPLYFLEQGSDVARSGAMAGLNTLLIIVSVQMGGFLLKRSARPDPLCHVAVLAFCASLLLLDGSSRPLVWIVFGGLVAGLPAGAFVNLPTEFLRPASRAAGMGVFYSIYYLGCAILPAAAGALYDLTGSARSTLWMSAALAFACIPSLQLFRIEMRRAAPSLRTAASASRSS